MALTEWIQRLKEGEPGASENLLPLVYEELSRLAKRQMRDQAPGATLQTTALVHEAWIRLAGHLETGSEEVLHFRALAAQAMRSVLVDSARARGARKRGGGAARVTLGDDPALDCEGDLLLDLHEALSQLATLQPDLAKVAELRLFSGLEHEEIAKLEGVATKTIERRWKTARAWLQDRLVD